MLKQRVAMFRFRRPQLDVINMGLTKKSNAEARVKQLARTWRIAQNAQLKPM